MSNENETVEAKLARYKKALENITKIDNYTDADAAAAYATEVLSGEDPGDPWWAR